MDSSAYPVLRARQEIERARDRVGLGWRGQHCPGVRGEAFYTRRNHILEKHDFDEYVEGLCERFYVEHGRPGLPPGATSSCY